MFSEDDKEYVIEALTNQVAQTDRPRLSLVTAFIGTSFAEDLTGDTPRELAKDAVRLCIINGWTNQPTWMERLIDNFQLRVIDGKIIEIWERSKSQPPAAIDPLQLTVINNSTLFVNRLNLRRALLSLATPAANVQPILIVTGGSKLGKSYSTNYIDHFSNVKASIITYRIVFDPELGLQTGPQELAKDMVYSLGKAVTSMPPAETNMKLYVRQLAVWVLNEAVQIPGQHWFVLDNFQGKQLRPDTKSFLIELSDRITTGAFAQKCRLILIGFDAGQLTVDPGKISTEIVNHCTVADIEYTITEISARSVRPVNIDKIRSEIISALPNGPEKMFELNQRLRCLLLAVNELNITLAQKEEVDFERMLLAMLIGLPNGSERQAELKNRLEKLNESFNN
ncbi:hypothetical protein GR160_16735 [Flavobacterium sp. Sd200]|uniref:hypothetical protein n=1 Tax=Flavobacterium sp. Sd200 TaxID=2692211 RepID=UPI001368B5FE|nr:hypothetical protein [Flavobacterium sp. Sd200]MXN92875.1 hypothetical protein [Flavobacterium sp. Sd200]